MVEEVGVSLREQYEGSFGRTVKGILTVEVEMCPYAWKDTV